MAGTFEVAVIGAGMSGIFLAEKLQRAGVPFHIYEKAADVGGTWRDNTYPGLHVDVVTRSYEFSFSRNKDWSHRYAPGSEIQTYLKKVARGLDLANHTSFNCEIVEARFEGGVWHLRSADDGLVTADVVFCGTGFLREPMIPNLSGRDSFA
ncbi:MAG TPA: NAD(P)/FAD-dependent oxidoreductase, partial [Acidimicrobiales bacterium]